MSSEMLQYVVVTVIALAAGLVVIRRVFGLVGTRAKGTGCASCASGTGACGTHAQASGGEIHRATDRAAVHPLTVLRRPPASR